MPDLIGTLKFPEPPGRCKTKHFLWEVTIEMKFPLRILIECAICAALAAALAMVKVFRMPQGGSISLGPLPIVLFALLRGPKYGLSAGLIAGILRLFLGAYIMHPLQAIIDYPLAYASYGLAGFFPSKKIIAIIAAFAGHLVCTVLSGAIFFASYAPEGTNVWIYSITYNASHVIPNALVTGLIALLIFPRLSKILSKQV
jgi:thiamine transporter